MKQSSGVWTKEYMRIYAMERYRRDPRASIFKNAKARALKNNLEFSITIDDIVIPEFCPYLGIRLFIGTYADRRRGHAPTLDRIDNSKGYTKDNIEVISDLANRMKQNASADILIKFALAVLDKFKV